MIEGFGKVKVDDICLCSMLIDMFEKDYRSCCRVDNNFVNPNCQMEMWPKNRTNDFFMNNMLEYLGRNTK